MEDKIFLWEVVFLYDRSQQAITISKLPTEAQEQGVKTVQNKEQRHKNDISDIVTVFLLLTVGIFQAKF